MYEQVWYGTELFLSCCHISTGVRKCGNEGSKAQTVDRVFPPKYILKNPISMTFNP